MQTTETRYTGPYIACCTDYKAQDGDGQDSNQSGLAGLCALLACLFEAVLIKLLIIYFYYISGL